MTELRDRHTIPVDTALIKTKDGEFTMICERVSDTIAVVPRIAYSDGSPVTFTGQFSISFAGGYGIPFVGCLDCARAAAKRFADIDVDWTDANVLKTLTNEQREQLQHAVGPLIDCDCDGTCHEPHCCNPQHY